MSKAGWAPSSGIEVKGVNGFGEPAHALLAREYYQARWTEQKIGFQLGGTGGMGGDMGQSFLLGGLDSLTPAKRYMIKVEQLIDNSAVMACIAWIMRNFPQAPLVVAHRKPDKSMGEVIDQHEMEMLISKPNRFSSGRLLWQATALSYNLSGNGFWIKIRNGFGGGKPVELWYEPHFSIRPVASKVPGELIANYEIFRKGHWYPVPGEDVVHFKFGQDPRNPMMGINLLATALREVFTDEEAAIYTATILKNMGVAGWIVSPQRGDIISNPTDLRNLMVSRIGDEQRGMPMVWSEALDIHKPDNKPTDMVAAELRQTPVERITALEGVNRMVAGLGKDPTYANFEQAREAAYEENIIPTKDAFADTLDSQLLPDFEQRADVHTFFSYANVRVLQVDQNELSARIRGEYVDGVIKRSQAQVKLGYEKDEQSDGYKLDPRVAAMLISKGFAEIVLGDLDPEMAESIRKAMADAAPEPEPTPDDGTGDSGDSGGKTKVLPDDTIPPEGGGKKPVAKKE